MKKKFIFLPLLLIASMFMAFYVMDVQAQSPTTATTTKAAPRTLAAPACSGFYGSFKATNWPGGKLTLTCPGKNRQRGLCVGADAKLSPGEAFSFNNCNCLDPKTKCLTVTDLPPGCTVKTKLACASNRETLDGSFQVECTDPNASPSKSPCTPTEGPAMGTSLAPSFVCLGLGADGGCLTPTTDPVVPTPCVDPATPSDILPSTVLPSDSVPSIVVPSGTSGGEFPDTSPSGFFPSDAAPSDGFGQTP